MRETQKPLVAVTRCSGYDDPRAVKEAVRRSIDLVGGMSSFIRSGSRVLIKPNLVMKKRPEEMATTHPLVLEAVIDLVHEAGARAVIGESPGGPFTPAVLAGVYRVCGIEEVARRTGAELSFDVGQIEVPHPAGRLVNRLTLASAIAGADAVISVSKLKTHGMTTYTGAVKNLFGAIPGLLKAEYHLRMPDLKDFANLLVDVATLVNPVLSVMDGIVGMEGAGPTAGKPRPIGAVLASPDPFALDVAALSLIGLDPGRVPTVVAARERGLPADPGDIRLVGEPLSQLAVKDFIIPKTGEINWFKGRVPRFLEAYLTNLLRPKPVFLDKVCIGCGDCFRHCPPKAITMQDRRPVVDLKACIRCFCCQELCPHQAVEIRRPWLAQKLLK